jgi:hypothetical protein
MSSATANGFDVQVYPFEIRERNGLFYLICKTFNVIEADASIDQAYSKLVNKRKQITEELSSFGVDVNVKSSIYDNKRTSTLEKWMQISIIVMCLGLPICMLIGTMLVASKASTILASAKNSIRHQVSSVINNPGQLTTMLNTVATKLESATPERREELKYSIRKIVTFIKPYAEEFQELSK